MKKIITISAIMISFFSFAHVHHHGTENVANAKKYESYKNQLEMDFSIIKDGDETIATFGEGHVDIKQVNGAYEPENKSFKLFLNSKGATLIGRVLMYDRYVYDKEAYIEGHSFHSYNNGFIDIHLDFNEDFTKVNIGDELYEGEIEYIEETKDRIFTEKNKLFTVILYGQANDNNKRFAKMPRIAEIFLNVKFKKTK